MVTPPNNPDDLLPCPCCEALTLGEIGGYEICRQCNWEDDPVQRADPNRGGGANGESLNEARAILRASRSNPRFARPRLP